jgi:O-antigen/teichoic acid export membrane protein
MSSGKSFLKQFMILFSGNTLAQVIPFLLAPIVARLFRPEEIAIQENFLALAALVSIAAAGRYEFAFMLPKTELKAKALLHLSIWISLGISSIALIALIFSDSIADAYRMKEIGSLMPFLAPAVLLLALLSVFSQWIVRKGWFSMVTGIRILQSLLQNLGYVILGYWGMGINGLIIAWLFGVLCPVLWIIWHERKTLVEFVPKNELTKVAREYSEFPTINAIHAFTDILATQFLLNWAITRNYGALALGLFALMNRYVRAPLNLIGSALGQLYFREAGMAQDKPQSAIKAFNRTVLFMLLLGTPILLFVAVFGPEIFAWYLGENWRDAGKMAQLMAPAYLFNMIASVVSSTAILKKKQQHTFLISIVGYALSLSLFIVGPQLSLEFENTLMLYSLVLSLYYIFLLFWYRYILNHTPYAPAN